MADTHDQPPPPEKDPRSSLNKPTGPRRFRPNMTWTIFCLLALCALLFLGTWQVSRFFETSSEHEFYHGQHHQKDPVTDLNPFQGPDRLKELHWRRVELTGRIDGGAVELLAARYRLGRLGYGVMAPLVFPEGSKPAKVLVYMGWVPTERLEEYQAALSAGTHKTVTIKGRIEPVYSSSNRADYVSIKAQDGMEVWRSPAPAALAVRHPGLDPDLIVFSGEQVSGQPVDTGKIPLDGYPPQPRLLPSKHIEYFMTWYGAALALVCVWVALSFRREDDTDVHARPEGDDE